MNEFFDKLDGATLALGDYLQAVKMTLDEIFSHDVWVVAEIRAMNTKGGHYYFELADKDEDGAISASCRATLWRYQAGTLLKKFEQKTGTPLASGLKVLLKGRASFHAQYGFSFNISDIDPNYTLGELAQDYMAMKQKLQDNGLFELNKRLSVPFDITRVVVIAPEKAAGLGDFRAEADRLANAGACHFFYRHATFQGNHAAQSVRQTIMAALADFSEHESGLPDLLVIIRGGGAVGDLAYLNEYELAAMVAECPVPVWVGIGHERDMGILDEVAHTRFDTPSKVILGIEKHLATLWQTARSHHERICHLASQRLVSERRIHEQRLNLVRLVASNQNHKLKSETGAWLASIKKDSRHFLSLKKDAQTQLLYRHRTAFHAIKTARKNIEHWRSFILTQHPSRTLQKGYVLVRDAEGQVLKSATAVEEGQRLTLTFHDGDVSVRH